MSDGALPDVIVRSLSEFSLLDALHALERLGADANNAAPASYDAEAFDYRYRADHLDRVSSLAAVADGRIVGMLLASRRGGTTHLSGLAVAPAHQRRGIASTLLGQVVAGARRRGDVRIVTEVLADDARAGAFYDRHGFTRVRDLGGWARTTPFPEGTDTRLEAVDTAVVATAVATHAPDDLPWFYHPATLYGATAPARGYALDGVAHCIVVPKPSHLTIRALVVAPGHRRRGRGTALLQAMAARHPAPAVVVHPLLPGTYCAEFLTAAGFAPVSTRHHERELRL